MGKIQERTVEMKKPYMGCNGPVYEREEISLLSF